MPSTAPPIGRSAVVGWDVGGVNTKVAHVVNGEVRAVRTRPFELQRSPTKLVSLFRELSEEVGGGIGATHAVTMTAELSQMFRTKREGVAFVLDAVQSAFPSSLLGVFAVDGRFLTCDEARREPLAVAAANWAATARIVARRHPDALLVDIGSTTTDIIPIVAGQPVARGQTDPGRLASGELVYSGAVRTPAEAMASCLPIAAGFTGVSAEGFALAGDVHVWRGDLAPADYASPTPDGRPATKEFAGERLARVVCADRELLDEAAVSVIADALAGAQVQRIVASIRRVWGHHPMLQTAVVTGLGAFIAEAAAREAGLAVVSLARELGDSAARCAPAASVGLLFEQARLSKAAAQGDVLANGASAPAFEFSHAVRGRVVETVVKLGGGVFDAGKSFDAVLETIARHVRGSRCLIVPGGGPFADTVRRVDRQIGLSNDAAHWMAVLAMDQYADLVVSRFRHAVLVTGVEEIETALGTGCLPVLAPSRWLRQADPLPHRWDVTSDSIAAWIAGAIGATQLVLIKPPGATGDLVDQYFDLALPPGVKPVIVCADQEERLRLVLNVTTHDC